MSYIIYIGICIFVLLIVGVWLAYRFYKKKKKQAEFEKNIPKEILEDFNEAEEQMKGGLKANGKSNPYSILWEITKKRSCVGQSVARANVSKPSSSRTVGANEPTEQSVGVRQLYSEPSGRQDLQTRTTESSIGSAEGVRKVKRTNIKLDFSRIRSRGRTDTR